MAGYVYLIGSHTFRWYKIGKSANPTIRARDLGILLPFRVEVVTVWKMSAYHAMERMLHEKYAANRVNGEWFSFDKKELQAIIEEMQWAATDAAAGFSNIERDFGPNGTHFKVKFKKTARPITPEERTEIIKNAIAAKLQKPYCITCRRRLPPEFVKTSCLSYIP
jgi:hypothetical protein